MINLDILLAQFDLIVAKLRTEAKANAVALIDKNGQLITKDGSTDISSFQLDNDSSLQKLKGEREVSFMTDGSSKSFYMSIHAEKVFLLVVFDSSSSLGLVRLKAKTAIDSLKKLIEPLGEDFSFAIITNEDIDNIFSDGLAINLE